MTTSTTQSMMLDERSGLLAHPQVGPAQLRVGNVLFFLLLHAPLAVLMVSLPDVAMVHALACLAVGVAWAASRTSLDRLVNLAAYIAGAEVLWRMTGAPVFWESGKYAVVLILLLAIQRSRPLKATRFPAVFFALLVPSALLIIATGDLTSIKQHLSFNLSGPLALAVCAAFFSRVQLTTVRIQRLVTAFLGPVVGIVSVVLFKMSAVEKITFGGASSKLGSGGFGPNQVASVFGFGVLAALLVVVLCLPARQRGLRWLMLGLSVLLAAQAALTFSRGGLYMAAGGALAAAIVMVRNASLRVTVIITACLFSAVAAYAVLPRLDAFTEGQLSKRFADTDLTGRDIIARSDIDLWMDNPLLGVGPGMAVAHRSEYFRAAAAHTEYTRLLAEHGAFGLAALVMLVGSSWRAFRRARPLKWKAFVGAMIAFGFLYLAVNAMRLVLPAFALGLAFASFEDE